MYWPAQSDHRRYCWCLRHSLAAVARHGVPVPYIFVCYIPYRLNTGRITGTKDVLFSSRLLLYTVSVSRGIIKYFVFYCRICNSVMITERKFTRKEYYVAFMNERSFGVSPFLKTTSSICAVPHGTVLVNFNLLLRSDTDPYPGSGAFLTPRSGMGKKSRSGSGWDGWEIKIRIRGLDPGGRTSRIIFRELRNNFFGFQILNCLMRMRESFWPWIRDGKFSDPG